MSVPDVGRVIQESRSPFHSAASCCLGPSCKDLHFRTLRHGLSAKAEAVPHRDQAKSRAARWCLRTRSWHFDRGEAGEEEMRRGIRKSQPSNVLCQFPQYPEIGGPLPRLAPKAPDGHERTLTKHPQGSSVEGVASMSWASGKRWTTTPGGEVGRRASTGTLGSSGSPARRSTDHDGY